MKRREREEEEDIKRCSHTATQTIFSSLKQWIVVMSIWVLSKLLFFCWATQIISAVVFVHKFHSWFCGKFLSFYAISVEQNYSRKSLLVGKMPHENRRKSQSFDMFWWYKGQAQTTNNKQRQSKMNFDSKHLFSAFVFTFSFYWSLNGALNFAAFWSTTEN